MKEIDLASATPKQLIRIIELFHKYAHIPYYDMDDGTSLDEAKNYALDNIVNQLERLDSKTKRLAKLDEQRKRILAER